MAKVSVILPSYNRAEWLKEAIQSILDQTFADFELIVIDDASTDNSRAVIQSFSDPRLKPVFKTKNEGYPTALQEAIKLSSGKYIARMDSDDICRPTRFEKQVSYLENNPNVMVVGAHAQKFDANNENLGLISYPEKHHDLMIQLLTRDTCMVHPVVMFRASVFKEFNYDLSKIPTEDYDLWARIGLQHELANIPEVLIDYRLHDGQESVTKMQQRQRVIMDTQKMLLTECGIEASDQELILHRSLFVTDFKEEMDYLIKAEKWLSKLAKSASAQEVFNEEKLLNKIGDIFYLLCTTLAPILRKGVREIFNQSSLSKHLSGTRFKSTKLFFKQLL